MNFILPLAAIPLALLSACSEEPVNNRQIAANPVGQDKSGLDDGPAPVSYSYDGWIGRWTGVEGTYVEISPIGDGNYKLEMQSDLDTKGTYTGTPNAQGISFERQGKQFTLDEAKGDATGLKYLAGKQDCLMTRKGEGYCRD